MIICFEGPSAIGKTTLSQDLSGDFLAVAEVNLLFKSPKEPSKFWYYDKQFERFSLAKNAVRSAILDGDVFQPLWYNWTYGFPKGFPSLEETIQYYTTGIKQSLIQFPDLYFVFTADEATLTQRKKGDSSRKRGNFSKHLQLIQTQKKYFHFLQKHTNIQVKFIAYEQFESTKEKVLEEVHSFQSTPIINHKQTILKIGDWLRKTAP